MKIVDLDQRSKQWENFRINHIGASDTPVIMGVSPWKTPYQLWQEKLGIKKNDFNSFAMKRGINLEPIALKEFNKQNNCNCIPLVAVYDDFDFMSASFDGIDLEKGILVEIKCPNKKDQELAKEGNIPKKYYPQLQKQLLVSGFTKIYYFSYSEESNYTVEVMQDVDYQSQIIIKECEFWKNIENLKSPQLNDKDVVTNTDPEFLDLELKYIQACELYDKYYLEKQRLKDLIIEKSNGKSCNGSYLKISKFTQKGKIEYDKIPELKDVDLDKYRGEETENYRITIK